MSNYTAIWSVTETLKSLLKNRMEVSEEMPGITVSVGPPDLEPQEKVNRVNLYLYKIEESRHFKNIPRDSYPAGRDHQPLHLVLHYLLTAFPDIDGYDVEYDHKAHLLLGSAMHVFHDYPIIDSIEIFPGTKSVHTSNQGEHGEIRITLEPLGMSELSTIWIGLNSASRLSIGYEVSTVQVKSM